MDILSLSHGNGEEARLVRMCQRLQFASRVGAGGEQEHDGRRGATVAPDFFERRRTRIGVLRTCKQKRRRGEHEEREGEKQGANGKKEGDEEKEEGAEARVEDQELL